MQELDGYLFWTIISVVSLITVFVLYFLIFAIEECLKRKSSLIDAVVNRKVIVIRTVSPENPGRVFLSKAWRDKSGWPAISNQHIGIGSLAKVIGFKDGYLRIERYRE